VKQARQLFRDWINARDIRALVEVTKRACEREIALDRRPLVLPGDHMIDGERQTRESLG
jgi:hypothetical protein